MAHFGIVDVQLLKHQKTWEVTNATTEKVHIKDDHFLYLSGSHRSNSYNTVHTVNYKPIPDRLEQMAEREADRDNDEEKLKIDWREDIPLSAKSRTHRLSFVKVLKDFESIWDVI